MNPIAPLWLYSDLFFETNRLRLKRSNRVHTVKSHFHPGLLFYFLPLALEWIEAIAAVSGHLQTPHSFTSTVNYQFRFPTPDPPTLTRKPAPDDPPSRKVISDPPTLVSEIRKVRICNLSQRWINCNNLINSWSEWAAAAEANKDIVLCGNYFVLGFWDLLSIVAHCSNIYSQNTAPSRMELRILWSACSHMYSLMPLLLH